MVYTAFVLVVNHRNSNVVFTFRLCSNYSTKTSIRMVFINWSLFNGSCYNNIVSSNYLLVFHYITTNRNYLARRLLSTDVIYTAFVLVVNHCISNVDITFLVWSNYRTTNPTRMVIMDCS
jgi:hypothetical protein